MISNPTQGQEVYLWYAENKRTWAPHHGKRAIVIIPGKGKPRNHLVICDTLPSSDRCLVSVPCGNLITQEQRWDKLKKEFIKRRDNLIKLNKKRKVRPSPPIYDDIYFEGIEYLDTL